MRPGHSVGAGVSLQHSAPLSVIIIIIIIIIKLPS
jgi:hypothetical protein